MGRNKQTNKQQELQVYIFIYHVYIWHHGELNFIHGRNAINHIKFVVASAVIGSVVSASSVVLLLFLL